MRILALDGPFNGRYVEVGTAKLGDVIAFNGSDDCTYAMERFAGGSEMVAAWLPPSDPPASFGITDRSVEP